MIVGPQTGTNHLWHECKRCNPPEPLLPVYTPTQFTHRCGLHHTHQVILLVECAIECSSNCSIEWSIAGPSVSYQFFAPSRCHRRVQDHQLVPWQCHRLLSSSHTDYHCGPPQTIAAVDAIRCGRCHPVWSMPTAVADVIRCGRCHPLWPILLPCPC